MAGIKDPVVDALVDRVIFATDRDDLVAATHALDRVLLWNYYVVPQWHRAVVWLAYWNKFSMPAKQPSYIGVDINSWWIDPAKETALQPNTGAAIDGGPAPPCLSGFERRGRGRHLAARPGLRRHCDRHETSPSC